MSSVAAFQLSATFPGPTVAVRFVGTEGAVKSVSVCHRSRCGLNQSGSVPALRRTRPVPSRFETYTWGTQPPVPMSQQSTKIFFWPSGEIGDRPGLGSNGTGSAVVIPDPSEGTWYQVPASR